MTIKFDLTTVKVVLDDEELRVKDLTIDTLDEFKNDLTKSIERKLLADSKPLTFDGTFVFDDFKFPTRYWANFYIPPPRPFFYGVDIDCGPDFRPATAFHEAGHVVLGRRFGVPITSATIVPSGEQLGHTAYAAGGLNGLAPDQLAMFALAGMLAEKQAHAENRIATKVSVTDSATIAKAVCEIAEDPYAGNLPAPGSDQGLLLLAVFEARRLIAPIDVPIEIWQMDFVTMMVERCTAELREHWDDVVEMASRLLKEQTVDLTAWTKTFELK